MSQGEVVVLWRWFYNPMIRHDIEIESDGKMNNTNIKNELRYKGIEFVQASGWQRSDQKHPAGNGILGYRVVYKTLKLIPFPAVNLTWPNLRVRMVVENVELA